MAEEFLNEPNIKSKSIFDALKICNLDFDQNIYILWHIFISSNSELLRGFWDFTVVYYVFV